MLFAKEKADRLTIIDPNRPENNISGGSRLISGIIEAFRYAHDLLIDRMSAQEQDRSGRPNDSILRDLLGGDFTAYEEQRKQLGELYFGLTGQDIPTTAQVSSHSGKTTRLRH